VDVKSVKSGFSGSVASINRLQNAVPHARSDTVRLSRYQLMAEVDRSVPAANGSVVNLLPALTCLGVTIDQER